MTCEFLPLSTRRSRAASASAFMDHFTRKDDAAVSTFDGWVEAALRHDGQCAPEIQAWCDEILTLAGYAPTYAERRIATAAPRPPFDVDTKPLIPNWAIVILCAATLALFICATLSAFGALVDTATAATLTQAEQPAFVEWSE